MISSEIGEPEEVVHELMKYMFNSNKEYVTGELKSLTTTKSTIKSFEIYLQKIKYWAKNYLGILIPDPNKVNNNDLKGIAIEYESMFF